MALAIALALHVLGVVVWIGGVALVTTVLLPAARAAETRVPGSGAVWFESIEHRFAGQARWTVALTGVTGVFMLDRLGLWRAWREPSLWWVPAMIVVWVLFASMLYVVEPLARFRPRKASAGRLRRMQALHAILLALSLVTVAGAALGSHGMGFG